MRHLFIVLFLSSSVSADLVKHVKEYLGVSTEVKNLSYNFEAQKISELSEELSRSWNLTISETYSDSDLDKGPFTFSAPGEKTKTTYLSLEKENIYGGEFTLSGTYYDFDGKASDGSPRAIKSYSQELKYTQYLGANFLGRVSKLELGIEEKETQYQKMALEGVKSKELLEFVNHYIDLQRDLTLKKLSDKAYKRSQARLNLVSRQVKDGLKEKVDLLSTKNSHFGQREQQKVAGQQLKSSQNLLEAKLERKVVLDEVSSFKIKNINLDPIEKKSVANNIDMKSIEAKLNYLEDEIAKNKKSVFPTIALSATYETNNFETTKSPIQDGTIGSDNVNKEIALSVVIPIGYNAQKNALKIANLNKLHATYEKKITKNRIEKRLETLISALDVLDQNIKSVVNRYNLAVSSLKEYNRLYSRGRVSLDQVIRAEEDLINTEKSFVQFKVEREKSYYSLLDLYGELVQEFL